jgi:hypothetical protein
LVAHALDADHERDVAVVDGLDVLDDGRDSARARHSWSRIRSLLGVMSHQGEREVGRLACGDRQVHNHDPHAVGLADAFEARHVRIALVRVAPPEPLGVKHGGLRPAERADGPLLPQGRGFVRQGRVGEAGEEVGVKSRVGSHLGVILTPV